MSDRPKAQVVRLSPDQSKIVASILLILKTAREHGKQATQYDIVKSLFLADRRHLNEYGRPITFDNYVAMKHGPVPSQAYDLLKPQSEGFGTDKLPWRATPVPGSRALNYAGLSEPDLDELSPSEVEILVESFITIKSLSFGQVRKITHEDPAYIDAWEDDENGNGSFPMSLGMLFDVPDMALASDLEFYSKNSMK